MMTNSIWNDVGADAGKSYVVQTPSAIVQRCLLMTTDPGDLVLDPTCGSGTTAFVAEAWGRRWITIDTSRVALALARARIAGFQETDDQGEEEVGGFAGAEVLGSSTRSHPPRARRRAGW
jgi:adenine-specific DNA-methyltransferase